MDFLQLFSNMNQKSAVCCNPRNKRLLTVLGSFSFTVFLMIYSQSVSIYRSETHVSFVWNISKMFDVKREQDDFCKYLELKHLESKTGLLAIPGSGYTRASAIIQLTTGIQTVEENDTDTKNGFLTLDHSCDKKYNTKFGATHC